MEKQINRLPKKNTTLFKDKDGKWAIVQFPNIPLSLWIITTLTMYVVADQALKESLSLLRDAVLFTWSYLEITAGDSPFRRILGSVVMALLVVKFFA